MLYGSPVCFQPQHVNATQDTDVTEHVTSLPGSLSQCVKFMSVNVLNVL